MGSDSIVEEPDGEVRLERFLPHRLAVVTEAMNRGLDRACARQFGVTLGEWRVLTSVGELGPAAAKEICRHANMHKTKVSRATATLERRGLIERESNPADLREAFLNLTADGRAALAAMTTRAHEFSNQIEATLAHSDRLALDRILDRLTRAVETIEGERA